MLPPNAFDRADQLVGVLGSFWADTFAGREQVQSLATGQQLMGWQTLLDAAELVASLSRFTVPLFHRENWSLLSLRGSQRNHVATNLVRYDDGDQYDQGQHYDAATRTAGHTFPLPAGLVQLPLLLNRFTAPSLCWQPGIDFATADGAITFRQNPCEDGRVAKRPIYADGQIVDEEAVLWIYNGEYDWETTYRQFGYAVGLHMQSGRGYRELLNAVFDGLLFGPARQRVVSAFSAITGLPLVQEPQETVTEVRRDSRSQLVITDRHVYQFPVDSTPTVRTGDTVRAGDTLTTDLEFYELNRGEVPELVRALAIGTGFLAQCFYGELLFENKLVPLAVTTDAASGFTRLEFPLGGFPADRQQFFDELHARGVAAAMLPVDPCDQADAIRDPGNNCDTVDAYYRRGTLAHLLDQRPQRLGEPTAASLPKQINPLQFLVTQVLRNNACVVRIRLAGTTSGVGLQHVRSLQRLLPPQMALLLVLELTPHSDSITVSQLAEDVSTFQAAEVVTDNLVASDGGATIKILSGSCQ